jgi:uncharacterized membrane protein
MKMLKKASISLLIIAYLFAGINHFREPASYIHIIPHYIPCPKLMNLLAGFFEILFGLLLIFKKSRPFAAWGIILMLIAFLPVHISMIGDASLKLGNITVTPFLAWLRLALQPLLMFWAWWHTKPN